MTGLSSSNPISSIKQNPPAFFKEGGNFNTYNTFDKVTLSQGMIVYQIASIKDTHKFEIRTYQVLDLLPTGKVKVESIDSHQTFEIIPRNLHSNKEQLLTTWLAHIRYKKEIELVESEQSLLDLLKVHAPNAEQIEVGQGLNENEEI